MISELSECYPKPRNEKLDKTTRYKVKEAAGCCLGKGTEGVLRSRCEIILVYQTKLPEMAARMVLREQKQRAIVMQLALA